MSWIFVSDAGFFSIALADPARDRVKPDTLVIRARVRTDLDALRERYMPLLGETIATPHRDYPYRAYGARHVVAEGYARIALDSIDYTNFKNCVGEKQGHARAASYGTVWSGLVDAERRLERDDRMGRHRGRARDRSP